MAIATVLVGGCSQGTAGGAEVPLIRSGSEYAEVLLQAETAAAEPMAKVAKGQALSEDEKTQLRSATALFEGLIAYQPAKADARFAVGRIYEALGETDKAKAQYREANKLSPKPEQEMLGSAQKLAKSALDKADKKEALTDQDRKNLQEAAQQTEKQLAKKPKDPDLHYASARINEALGNDESAVKDYRESLRLRGKPEEQIAKEAMAAAEAILAKYDSEKTLDQIDKVALDKLTAIFDSLFSYQPNNPNFRYTGAHVFKLAGQKDKAIQTYIRYTEMMKVPKTDQDHFKVAAAHYWAAKLSNELGDYKLASEQAEQAANYYPSEGIILTQAAKAYVGLKQYDRASVYISALLELDPKDAEALNLKQKISSAKSGT